MATATVHLAPVLVVGLLVCAGGGHAASADQVLGQPEPLWGMTRSLVTTDPAGQNAEGIVEIYVSLQFPYRGTTLVWDPDAPMDGGIGGRGATLGEIALKTDCPPPNGTFNYTNDERGSCGQIWKFSVGIAEGVCDASGTAHALLSVECHGSQWGAVPNCPPSPTDPSSRLNSTRNLFKVSFAVEWQNFCPILPVDPPFPALTLTAFRDPGYVLPAPTLLAEDVAYFVVRAGSRIASTSYAVQSCKVTDIWVELPPSELPTLIVTDEDQVAGHPASGLVVRNSGEAATPHDECRFHWKMAGAFAPTAGEKRTFVLHIWVLFVAEVTQAAPEPGSPATEIETHRINFTGQEFTVEAAPQQPSTARARRGSRRILGAPAALLIMSVVVALLCSST